MSSPRWVCYSCGQPVGLRDGEPFRWFPITTPSPAEIYADAAICEKYPDCATARESDPEARPMDELGSWESQ
jgi:hypothetical protein